jgi:hypothetical protein
MMDLERIGQVVIVLVQRDDLATAGRRREVMRERRDPAAAWRVRGNEGRAQDEVAPLGRSA